MDKKIAFFDIDGTMVDVPNGMLHPTDETKRVIQEFQRQGNYIVVATARGRLPESVKDINFDGMICSDGHYIEFHNEILIDNNFSLEEIKMQIELYDTYDAEYVFGGHYGGWSSHPDGPRMAELDMAFGSGGRGPKVPQIVDLTEIKANSATPLFATKEAMFACKNALPEDWAITAYETGLVRMDVHLPGFHKGSACVFLMEKLGINPEHGYAFGDGENDIEMLSLIKHGIAMGNADAHIKAVAADVTDTVGNEGIAKSFKKYFDI